jgi:hypothetical protein
VTEDDGGTAALLDDVEPDATGINVVVSEIGHDRQSIPRSTAMVNTIVLR